MSPAFGIRLQTVLVVALFLASLGLLFFNSFLNLQLPWRELEARDQLRAAADQMADEASPLLDLLPAGPDPPEAGVKHRLHELANATLMKYPQVEGGSYFPGSYSFGGAAFPTGPNGPDAPPRDDPPPLETPSIRTLAREGAETGEPVFNVRNVGPSRVAVVTAPVGRDRPARMAVWVMYRLTGPAQLEARSRQFGISTVLALGGVVLSLFLTWNLGRALARQRAELRRAEHLAGLGRLLAGVAHEVRNPLAGIRSTVQLWERLPDAARTPASLEAVLGAVDRLDALVNRLLYFARPENAERRPVNLNRILGETLDLLEAQAAGQSVTLERDLAPDLLAVDGSDVALRQVALNLFSNALHAMPGGGRLRCQTRVPAGGRAVEVRVADTGHGIAEADRKHLFEPFFTTRPEGTGLGLALCREIVQNQGGEIRLEATSATGTTFLVRLPLSSFSGKTHP